VTHALREDGELFVRRATAGLFSQEFCMKKKLFAGMLAMVLVLGSVLVGCVTTEPAESPEIVSLEGTWTGTNGSNQRTIVFTGNTLHRQPQNDDWTFKQTATVLKLTKDGKTVEQGYTVSGDTLTLKFNKDGIWEGPYTKQ
jgi:hypothetical protein